MSHEYFLSVKLLNEHHLELLRLKNKATQAGRSLHMSKCLIVGNLMSRLNLFK